MQLPRSFADASPSALDWAVRNGDWMRRAPGRVGGARHHKEWLHFCVYGDHVDLLINFSVVDDVREAARAPHARHEEHARLTMLVREREWEGEVQSFSSSEVSIRAGDVDLRFGPSSVRYEGGRYRVEAYSRDRSTRAELELTPVAMPSIVHNVQYGEGSPINWLVVPRLVTSGRLHVGQNSYDLAGALAYHDHNWGHFGWGCNFAWEWGYGLPDERTNPWSLVFVRLSDRALTRSMMQGVFLWRGHREQRVFRDHELRVRHHGLLRAPRIRKVPPIMGLIYPDLATDIPAALSFDGDGDGDTVRGRFTTGEVAQVVLPNDRDLGVTVINEVSGRLEVTGRVRGEDLRIDGRAVFEFLGR